VTTCTSDATRLLEALAASHEKLIGLSQRLRGRPDILETSAGLTLRRYHSGSVIEGYVDAESIHGRGISFVIDVTWDPTWTIDYSVRESTTDGQLVLRQFPELEPESVAAVATTLGQAIDELITFADCMELGSELTGSLG
jgi:hypothetical protein